MLKPIWRLVLVNCDNLLLEVLSAYAKFKVSAAQILDVMGVGAAGGDRTHDPWLRRPILYPLSYSRTAGIVGGIRSVLHFDRLVSLVEGGGWL